MSWQTQPISLGIRPTGYLNFPTFLVRNHGVKRLRWSGVDYTAAAEARESIGCCGGRKPSPTSSRHSHHFPAETNAIRKPFIWTKDPEKILAAVKRGHHLSELIH